MTSLLLFLLLSFMQLTAGFGMLTWARISLKRGLFFPICVLTGIAVFSLVPFLLQLFYLPITGWSVFISLTLVCILLNLKIKSGINRLRNDWTNDRIKIKLYEIPALLVITAIVLISIWRCFYLPPTPRDLNSGAEAIAEFAVREGAFINSVFTVDVNNNNNPFKPPFIASLQIIYKLAGFPFGQLWLSAVFVSFVVFLYHLLSANVHRIFAGLLVIFLLAVPELYGYTFMALFDFSNAVFFCCALFFLFRFFESKQFNLLVFSALLMGFATYARSETLVLAGFMLPLMLVRNRSKPMRAIISCGLFLLPSLLFYLISVPLYINFYLPATYPVSNQITTDLFNLRPFFQRLSDMNSELIFSESGIDYYGYAFFIFLVIFVADLVLMRRMQRQGVYWLYAVLVVYLGLPFLGYLLPLLDLHHSTKRGLLKIFPLMVIYLGNTVLFKKLSQKIDGWERGDQ